MSKKTIDYDPVDNEEYNAVVMIKKITHLTKSKDGEITYIHLVNKVIIESNDSIRTLNARINSDN